MIFCRINFFHIRNLRAMSRKRFHLMANNKEICYWLAILSMNCFFDWNTAKSYPIKLDFAIVCSLSLPIMKTFAFESGNIAAQIASNSIITIYFIHRTLFTSYTHNRFVWAQYTFLLCSLQQFHIESGKFTVLRKYFSIFIKIWMCCVSITTAQQKKIKFNL